MAEAFKYLAASIAAGLAALAASLGNGKVISKTLEEIIETEKKVTVKVTQKVTVNQQKILEAIKNNPFITQDELSKVIGLSRKSIIQNMNKMKENSLIKRVGAVKNGHWEIL